MKIYLFRHGAAVDRDDAKTAGMDDSQRALIPKGRARNSMMLNWLKDQEIKVDLIASSPFLRATQTAAQLRPLLGGNLSKSAFVTNVVELIPSAPPQAFVQWAKTQKQNIRSLLVVGHEPHLSTLASWLSMGSMESMIELKKSGCLCLEVESLEDLSPKCAVIEWIIQPKLLKGARSYLATPSVAK